MRRLQLSERKKLRGIPRRLRSLSKWAEQFGGCYYPRSAAEENYIHWKIPVNSSLANPPHTNKRTQAQCMSHMLRAADLLSQSLPKDYSSYYRVTCLFTLPWMFSSELTIFYNPEYYLRFFGERHELEPRKLSLEYGFTVPNGFVERGFLVKDEAARIDEEWWCIGQPI
ncbi:DUF3916 domain-containing protein [Leptolyngbya sp. CCNP1308]|uniref:DUF3916 domain-containing protein n=1 Tax=Leptolyngbya sp. CCNP1308 TaxID=3110255 RepID=UPI002B21465B|nr:DUF3916 domain-containing protein [Leptolyngbya sp. CCNP1308]MEA5451618.1 DUF3916 domain-containing protein [Leptolyngbya sp. CCNP1308]